MELSEYADLDAVGLCELIRSAEVSAAEVEAVARRAIDLADAQLNASRPYTREAGAGAERLHVAVTTDAWSGTAVDPEVAAATITTATVLQELGHTVSEARPSVDPDALVEAMMLGVVATGAAMLQAPRRPEPSQLEAVSRQVLAETEAFTALDVMSAITAQHRVTRPVGLFFARHDLLVTPTLGQLPAPHGTLNYDDPDHTVRSWLRRLLEYGPFTTAFNVSGHPAISLPLGQSRSGLPIGVQLVAGPAREDLLLRVAADLEQAMPWKDRRPPVFAGTL